MLVHRRVFFTFLGARRTGALTSLQLQALNFGVGLALSSENASSRIAHICAIEVEASPYPSAPPAKRSKTAALTVCSRLPSAVMKGTLRGITRLSMEKPVTANGFTVGNIL